MAWMENGVVDTEPTGRDREEASGRGRIAIRQIDSESGFAADWTTASARNVLATTLFSRR